MAQQFAEALRSSGAFRSLAGRQLGVDMVRRQLVQAGLLSIGGIPSSEAAAASAAVGLVPAPNSVVSVPGAVGPSLPAWVPRPGEVVMLTQANGGLANRFRDVVAPYYDPFYSVKVVNDYSGAFKNPYWGAWGCTVFWGGGHAATNDNMVAIAEYRLRNIMFRRVSDPTPWFGTGTDATTRARNSTADANALLSTPYMESTIDGKPGAPHSYGSGDIIGPEHGGAANGTLLQVIAAAVNYRNDAGAIAAHELRFDDTTSTSGARRWRRVTDATGSPFGPWSAPMLTAFVGPQNRVYIATNGMNVPGLVRWFDRTTSTWVRGSGVGFSYDEADGYDSGIMFHVPSLGMLVCMYPLQGHLKVEWMNVDVAQPTLGGAANLSQPLALSLPWSAGSWCTHSNRLIVAGVAGDSSAAYEVEIPRQLTDAWPVVRAPFSNGATFQPADPARGYGLTWKKFQYDEKLRAIVYMPLAAASGDDQVWVYRPRGT
jgi:hypothetical protein